MSPHPILTEASPLVFFSLVMISGACGPTGPTAVDRPANVSTAAALEVRAFEEQLERDELLACRISLEQAIARESESGRGERSELLALEVVHEAVFMSDCLRLPRTVQKCQVFWYFGEHHRECTNARRAHHAQAQWEAERHSAHRAQLAPRHL